MTAPDDRLLAHQAHGYEGDAPRLPATVCGMCASTGELAQAQAEVERLREEARTTGFYSTDIERTALARAETAEAELDQARAALAGVLDVALGRTRHVYAGLCPDDIEGWDTRDPECPACAALTPTTGTEHQ